MQAKKQRAALGVLWLIVGLWVLTNHLILGLCMIALGVFYLAYTFRARTLIGRT